jgi:hypothetical protein
VHRITGRDTNANPTNFDPMKALDTARRREVRTTDLLCRHA